jgi:hypothetical protein
VKFTKNNTDIVNCSGIVRVHLHSLPEMAASLFIAMLSDCHASEIDQMQRAVYGLFGGRM